MTKVDAIFTADWHVREDKPTCRVDNFQKTQWRKVRFVAALQKRHGCPVIHAGDLFNHWKPSPFLISKTMENLPKCFYSIYGQHDLPNHSLQLAHKSGLYTLFASGRAKVLRLGTHYGMDPSRYETFAGRRVTIWHHMMWNKKKPFPDCADPPALHFLKRYKGVDVIITGDNHRPFVVKYEDRLLVNPGCLTRQRTNEVDYRPRVYLWSAKSNTVEPVYLPIDIDREAMSHKHVECATDRTNRIEAFLSRLNEEFDVEFSFRDNLASFERKNRTQRGVMEIVYRAIEKRSGHHE